MTAFNAHFQLRDRKHQIADVHMIVRVQSNASPDLVEECLEHFAKTSGIDYIYKETAQDD